MLAHIVTPANRGLYQRQLDQMHRQRRKVFVEQRGWTALDNGSPLEIDDFDHEHTNYILLLGDVGEVLASCRVTPSWKPHLNQTLSAFISRTELATGPGVWEISRWIAGPGKDKRTDTQCRALMLVALAEFSVSHQIDAYVGCMDLHQVNHMAEIGIHVDWLGEPREYGEGTAVALRVAAGQKKLDLVRKLFRVDAPVTVMPPAWTSDRFVDSKAFSIVQRAFECEDADELELHLEAMTAVSTRRWLASGNEPSIATLLTETKGHA
ncbi:MAG: acyl-homoserine-lactone synthase [Caulobacterales bacterium]|uniref:acyl-homoserine-lactone synthase n=1 Tax=Glycocaulis sp. TaxID=1969725 RepID=UPI003FA00E5F